MGRLLAIYSREGTVNVSRYYCAPEEHRAEVAVVTTNLSLDSAVWQKRSFLRAALKCLKARLHKKNPPLHYKKVHTLLN